jgi:uncharacterized membrane protein
MMDFDGNGLQWMMGFHGIWTIVFLAIVLVAGVAIIRERRRSRYPSDRLEHIAILYANGDISSDEYLRQKQNII